MATATEVGGDYYDYILADDGTLTLTLGDAAVLYLLPGGFLCILRGINIVASCPTRSGLSNETYLLDNF